MTLGVGIAEVTRTQLRDLYHRNQPAARVDQALAALHTAGKATRQRVLTGGRPRRIAARPSVRRRGSLKRGRGRQTRSLPSYGNSTPGRQ